MKKGFARILSVLSVSALLVTNTAVTAYAAPESDDSGSSSVSESTKTPEISVEESSSETTESSVEESSSETTESSVEESSSETTESSVEESSSETTESSVEESSSETTESSVEESSSETTESSVEESSGETTESTVEESSSEITESSVEESSETTESSVEESSEVSETSEDIKELSVKVTTKSVSVQVNKTFNVTVSAEGGKGSYKYNYRYIKDSGSVQTAAEGIGVSTYKYVFTEAGKYTVIAEVADEDGNTAQSTAEVTVYEALADNGTKLGSTAVNLGGKIKATASFTGGIKPYTYQYSYKSVTASSWTTVSDNSKSSTYTYTMPKTAGYYTIRVTVKDAEGRTFSKNISAAVKNATGKTLSQSDSKISATAVALGGSVTTTATPTGGTAPYKYLVSYQYGSGTWTNVDSSYQFTNKRTFNLPNKAGKYTVRIGVKDYAGKYVAKTFTVNVKTIDVSKSTVSKTTVKINEAVTLTAKSLYGVGNVKYRYSYHISGKSLTYIGGYTTKTSQSMKFTSAGTYYFRVTAKDETGKTTYKQFQITVKPMNADGSTISATTISDSGTVKLTAKSSYVSGNVKYRFSYRAEGKSWTYLGSYATTATKSFKFSSNGIYYVRVSARDSAGTYSEKQFKINVYRSKAVSLKTGTTLQNSANWKSKSLYNVPAGSWVNVIKKINNWYLVKYNSSIGYIYNLAFGGTANYSAINTNTLPVIADDIIFKYGKSIRPLYNYVKWMSYSNVSNDSLENLCVYILKYRRGACYHRAALLYYLLNRAGFEVVRINDGIDMYTGGSPHNWCMIKTGSGWRHIDPTGVIGLSEMYLVTDSKIAPYFSWNRNKYPAAT